MLDTSALRQAIAQLDEALAYCAGDLAQSDPRLALHLRAAAIQAFEFTYELSVKMLRRYLATIDSNPAAVQELSFNDLVRSGWEKGLLRCELEQWKEFRRDRGTTSHVYDQGKALGLFANIPAFLEEARFLCQEMERRQEERR